MNVEEINFFNTLIEKTNEAYKQSEIKDKKWGYSVTATRIMKRKPLIIGFNWGVDAKWIKRGNEYEEQKEYPDKCFTDNFNDLGSLKRVIPYFKKYYPDALSGMQTNFCFFRSEKEEQISNKDLNLSSKLFDEYLRYSVPSIIISFSNRLMLYLEKTGRLTSVQIKNIKSKNKVIKAAVSKFELTKSNLIDFVNLPHPNYPITNEARENAWDFCFDKVNNP